MAMPFAPANSTQATQAPAEYPWVMPQYGTTVIVAIEVNKNTMVGAQLMGARGAAEILCDMIGLGFGRFFAGVWQGTRIAWTGIRLRSVCGCIPGDEWHQSLRARH
jgi:hypothetical protein